MLACTLEATAKKPGNVHPDASFSDLCYADFLAGAAAMRPTLDRVSEIGVGAAVLECVRATRALTKTNVNLGMALLLAPLAAVTPSEPLRTGIGGVLGRLTVDDTRRVYGAIRWAQPGGLGRVDDQDVADEPTEDLCAVMRRAADRDLIARQFTNNFREVFWGASLLTSPAAERLNWDQAIVWCQLEYMANFPDTLIARKCGVAEAQESAQRAAAVLAAEWPATPDARRRLVELDQWLRARGHDRNPGTTADMIAACLYVVLHENRLG
jgi:triphosphoribosyl-dephospho-CoA synthase